MSGILASGAIASIVSNRRRDAKAAAAVSGGGSEGLTFKAMAGAEEDLRNAMPQAVIEAETELVAGAVDVFSAPDAPLETQQEDESHALGSAGHVEASLASSLEDGEKRSFGEVEGSLDAAEGVLGGALSEGGGLGEGVGGTVEPLVDAVAEAVESVVGDGAGAPDVEEGLGGYRLGEEEKGSSPVEQEDGGGEKRRGESEEGGA